LNWSVSVIIYIIIIGKIPFQESNFKEIYSM
jgi:hypothetical protein